MTRNAVGGALLLLGLALAALVWVDGHLVFVKQSLTWSLYLSAAVLVVLGVATLRATDADAEPLSHTAGAHEGHGHAHAGRGPRMGVLLLAPLVVLLLVPPTSLGAFAADRGAANRLTTTSVFDPLPAPGEDGAVELALTEVVARALAQPASIEDATLRTDGFVVLDEGRSDAYLLSRFAIGCCAVDAAPFQVVVRTTEAVPAEEDWVRATLRFTGDVVERDGSTIPVFDLVAEQPIPEPAEPYLY